MRRLLVLSLVLFSIPAFAQSDECSSDVTALRALYDLRGLMFRPYTSSYDLDTRAERYIEELRDPLPGGGYRWVHWVRPSGDGPVVKREHTVGAEHESGDPDVFEASGNHPFAVKVVVPRKRSLTRSNKELWVGDVDIRYWVDGREKRMTKTIDQWLAPDTSRSFDLNAIADRAEVTVETSTRNASKKESLVEVHFRQAVAEDDPDNPGYEAIGSLRRLATNSFDPISLDYEIARFERRLFGTPMSAPISVIFRKLQEAEKLLKSEKEEDHEKGRKLLAEATKSFGTAAETRD
jgi:hypothetical protein